MDAIDWKVALCTAVKANLVGSEKFAASKAEGPWR